MYTNKTRRYLAVGLAIGWLCAIAYFVIRHKASEGKLYPAHSQRIAKDQRMGGVYQDKRVMMGTFIEVISPQKEAAKIVFDEIGRIEGLLSKYKPDSEVSKLNKLGTLKVSPETFYIVKKSKEFYSLSDGAFDITVASLMDLWGFTEKKYSLPSEEKIKGALKLVGSDKIILRDNDNVIQFKLPGMKIDLGAIAKGYAVDCAVNKLTGRGITNCLINAGGQIYCLGDNFGRPWKVAIKGPRGKNFLGYLELRNKAVSTSGDYEQYFIKDGVRFSHIFNPKTGYPADTKIISVTIIADSGLIADALSTAVFVLGKEKGKILIKQFKDAEGKITESE